MTGVQVTADNETAGYVDKVVNGGLLDAMKGQNVPDGFVLGETVDGVSQATKTSRGIVSGVNPGRALL